jgi:hypothetical protein
MNQHNPSVRNRRLSPRRKPKRSTTATGRLGALATGPNVVLSLLDLSKSGARLLVGAPLAEGQEVEVALQGQDQAQPLKLPAVVVWSEAAVGGGSCVGVFFWRWLHYTELRELTEP